MSFRIRASAFELGAGFSLVLAYVGIIFGCIAAWLTHVIWIVKALASDAGATAGQIALGVIGAFMPPVGVIHGVIIWFS